MAEHPILFSGPLVRAILEGRKSVTRRVVKPQPTYNKQREMWRWETPRAVAGWSGDRPAACALQAFRDGCPYGAPGETLWVRETHAPIGNEDGHPIDAAGELCGIDDALVVYRADVTGDKYGLVRLPGGSLFEGPWRPAIHMRRAHSRLSLRVLSVRVERLQDISEADILAEGVTCAIAAERTGIPWSRIPTLHDAWRLCWDSINAKRAPWSSNPWVWRIEFERVAQAGA